MRPSLKCCITQKSWSALFKPSVVFLRRMQQPVLPFLSKELGADEIQFGQLSSTINLLALIGGPFMGRTATYM